MCSGVLILNIVKQNTGVGSLSLLQGIFFPAQGSNPGLPHCRQILYQLSCKGSPWNRQCMIICKWWGREKSIGVPHWWPELLSGWCCYLMRGRRESGKNGWEWVSRENGDESIFNCSDKDSCPYLYVLVKHWALIVMESMFIDCSVINYNVIAIVMQDWAWKENSGL